MLHEARLRYWSLTKLDRTDSPESGHNRRRYGKMSGEKRPDTANLEKPLTRFTRDERRVDQTQVLERREGPQLAQQLVGGVRVAVQDKLLQGAAEEELQGARAEEPLARHVVEQELHQLRGQARQAAAVLHAGSCGGRGTAVRGRSGGGGGFVSTDRGLSPLISCRVARVAKAHNDGRLGVLKGLLGGEGCPWEVGGWSWCAALWRRSTAARPAATGAAGPPASSTSTASSSGASLK